MSWFRTDPPARVDADGEHALLIVPVDDAPRRVDVTRLEWIAFVNIGDSFLANENGWWLLGAGGGAVAVWCGCPVVDTVMRGPLAAAADAVGDLSILHLAHRPKVLRAAEKEGGVTELDANAVAALREAATVEPIQSVRAAPLLP